MGYQIRRSIDRGYFDHGWLKTYHTFSFASYRDPRFMGFRDLRVINEDRVEPGAGFPPHGHNDMEIISLVLEGQLAHRDSTGSQTTLGPNEIQTMSAGSGITHSEYNPSHTQSVHFLQIWIEPDKKGLPPEYHQHQLKSNTEPWNLIVSEHSQARIHQNVQVFLVTLKKEQKSEKQLAPTRYGWLQMIEGQLALDHDTLYLGDGVEIDAGSHLTFHALSDTRFLFFDLR